MSILADWLQSQPSVDCSSSVRTELCIHEMVEGHAAATPDAIALICEQAELRYAELNARANQLAHHLIALGVRPDDRIAIAIVPNLEMVIAMLAVLKAGGAYVPLDVAYPAERLAFMIDDARPRVVLTQKNFVPMVARLIAGQLILVLDIGNPTWVGLPTCNPDPLALNLTPSNLAYVIYTSGSAGGPKGVMVEHHSLVSSTKTRLAYYKKPSKTILLSSVSFDSSVAVIFGTLSAGGSLILPVRSTLLDPIELTDLISRLQIESFLCVPSFLNVLLNACASKAEFSIGSLQQIIVAGETCLPALVERVSWQLPNVTLYNEYGPTECSVWATVHLCSAEHDVSAVPIGRPIANTCIYILDEHGHPAPSGVAGEIYIGGGGVARGYMNRPDLTAERFLLDPFTDQPPEAAPRRRMYRTGDLGRWQPDGTIAFLGRIDDQIKIRGFRIEPTEIETALLNYPQLKEAVVLGREDTPGDKRLVAYFTAHEARIPELALRVYLASLLPEHFVPSAFVQLAIFPLLPNGKLDRKALPPPPARFMTRGASPPPQSPDEALLCRLFARLTSHDEVDASSDFFAIGGNSLSAMVLLTKLRQLGRQLPVDEFLAGPTPAAIAATWTTPKLSGVPPGVASNSRTVDRPTLFIIPGSGGDDPRLAALKTAWSDRFDCIVLKFPDWPDLIAPGMGKDAIIENFMQHIIDRPQSTPRFLAGYSLGGYAAWVVAERLARFGRPLDALCIIDADFDNPQYAEQHLLQPDADTHIIERLMRRLLRFIAALRTGDIGEISMAFCEVVAYRLAEYPSLLRRMARIRHWRLPAYPRFWLRHFISTILQTRAIAPMEMIADATSAQRPAPCKVILFYAADESKVTPGLGWRHLCDPLETEEVTGNHISLLQERGPASLYKKLPAALEKLSGVGENSVF